MIEKLFTPDFFRSVSGVIIDKLTQYLSDDSIRGLCFIPQPELKQQVKEMMQFNDNMPDIERLKQIVERYVETGIQVHSTGYMGRQFTPVVPFIPVFEAIGALVNQPASLYEAGQLPNIAERVMSEELGKYIGWEYPNYDMITTSGGSLANLTALLAARNHFFPEIAKKGMCRWTKQRVPAIAISADIHYSIQKSVSVLGLGSQNIITLPLNEKRQIDVHRAKQCLDSAENSGLHVFAIVANAGSTATGAFDPLDRLAALARSKKIWLHVDGAHGASFLLSTKIKHRLKGIHHADSLTWDAHKMLFVPPLCSMLFYRNKEMSYKAYGQDASYIFDSQHNPYIEYDSAYRSFECTKRPMMMNLWLLWAVFGKQMFEQLLDKAVKNSLDFYYELKKQKDFETLHYPQANIVCFRYIPNKQLSSEKLSELQLIIRKKIVENGRFFISKTNLDNIAALRTVFSNPFITIETCRELLDEIRWIYQKL